MSKPKIFISYSNKDKKWKDLIKNFFKIGEKFEIWNDRDIELGDNWYNKIKNSLHEADIALLLISSDFLISEFIKNEEIPDLLKRCEEGSVKVIPIFIRHFPKDVSPDWLLKPGKSFQGFPSPDKPLCDFRETEQEKELSIFVDKVYGVYFMNSQKSFAGYVNDNKQVLKSFNTKYGKRNLEQLKNLAKESISSLYWDKIDNAVTHQKLIENLLDASQHKEFLQQLENFTDEEEIEESQPLEQTLTDNVFLHFRQDDIDDFKYMVDIYARYKNIKRNKTLSLTIKNINSPESQQEFMKELTQLRKNTTPIHIIIPPELYFQNFRLWKNSKELIGLFHPIYLHSDIRYSDDLDEYISMIEEWDKDFLPQELLSNTLHPLCSDEDRYDIRTKKIGICFEYKPNEECIDEHMEVAKIALWSHQNRESPNDYIKWIGKNFDKVKLEKLPEKLQECNYVSLLWDDMSILLDLKKELEI